MSKSSVLREVLAAGPLTLDELLAKAETDSGYIFNRKKTIGLLSSLKQSGHVDWVDQDGVRRYRAIEQTPKKTNGSAVKAARIPQTYDGLARKYSDVDTKLLHRHVGTTLTVLEALIDLSDSDPGLVAAFRAHKEAVVLAMGAE